MTNISGQKPLEKITAEEFFAGGRPTDVFKKAARAEQISGWKEIYPQGYMVPGLCTQEEYDAIQAGTYHQDTHKRAAGTAWLRTQVVGGEGEAPNLSFIDDLYNK